jgi:SAM-dependent methyltransferase
MADADENSGQSDPWAVFRSDPKNQFSSILFLYFRIYKKKLLWNFMRTALSDLDLDSEDTLSIADVGASMGYDVLFLLRRLTQNFEKPLPCKQIQLSLIEGSQNDIAAEQLFLKKELTSVPVAFEYYSHPLVENFPLPEESHHLAICSEVVEHLEEPELLLREIFRILRPGGCLLFTTDNSPSFPQYLKRIPTWLKGKYSRVYARPTKESVTQGRFTWNGKEYPIYGHINLNPTRYWERLCKQVGFKLVEFGTYESIRRGGGSKSPLALLGYFSLGAIVYYLLPRNIGRFFGDTTALLMRKPK